MSTPAPVQQETLDLAEKFGEELKYDRATKAVSGLDKAYVKGLPPSLSEETVREVHRYNNLVIAALPLALGKKVIPHMKSDQGVTSVTAKMPTIGRDNLEVTIEREKQVRVPQPAGAPEVTKTVYGAVTAKYNMFGNRNAGELAKVKKELADQAMAAFGS